MQDTDESVDLTRKVLVSIMILVSLSNKGKPLKLRHNDISTAHFQGTAQRLIHIRLPAEGSSEVWRRQSWQIGQEHVWNSGCFPHLICGASGSFRRGKHSTALFHNPNQDVRMAMHGDKFECLLDDDGSKHIVNLLKPNTWIQRFELEQSCVVELWIQSWSGLNWTTLVC